jgi:hypothetical protein
VLPSAYLRVYRPLEAFPDPERAAWERLIVEGTAGLRRRPVYRDQPRGRRNVVGLLTAAEEGRGEIRLVDGQYYVCPWRTRVRVLASMLSLKESGPDEMVRMFLPETEIRRAARELSRIRRRDPGAAPSMLQSAWHVPIRWFILVDEEERRLVSAGEDRFRLFYWTPIAFARRRAEQALAALRRSDLEALADPVRELVRWLGSFPTRSVVELDYSSLSDMFTWDELDEDHSARDIQQAIAGLARRREPARAVEVYQAVATRWAEARSREGMN